MKPQHDEEHPREPSTPTEIKKQADEALDRLPPQAALSRNRTQRVNAIGTT